MRRVQLIAQNLMLACLLVQGATTLAAKPVVVNLLPEASTVSFKGSTLKNIVKFSGDGASVSGSFKISSPKAIEGQAVFKLDSLKLDLDSRAEHMKEDLEVTKFPEAKFVPTVLPWEDPSKVLTDKTEEKPFEGKLTLHGVEKLVQGTVSTSKTAADKVEYIFKFNVQLDDFKVTRRKHLGLQVGNDVEVEVKTLAKVVAQ